MRWNKLEKELLDEEIVSKALDLLDDLPGDPDLEALVQKYKDTSENLAEEEDLDVLDPLLIEMLAEDICSASNLPKDFFKGCQSEKEIITIIIILIIIIFLKYYLNYHRI